MRPVYADSPEVFGAFIAKRTKHLANAFCPEGPFTGMGFVDESGNLIAAVCYHDWKMSSIECSIAADSPKWATKNNIAVILQYPFKQLGVSHLRATILRSNKRARRLVEGVGFKLEGVLRKAANGADLCIYGMTDFEAERWFK